MASNYKNGNGNKTSGTKTNGSKTGKKIRRKSSGRGLGFFILFAIIFFTIGFTVSYFLYMRDNRVAENNQNQTTNLEDVTNGKNDDTKTPDDNENNNETEDEKPDNNNVDDNTDKDDGKDNGQANGEDEKPDGNDNGTTQDKGELPANPTEPNVEKLDVEALKQLDNTKYSWWIKLNNEHKTPEIPSNIKNLIDKYDGIYVGDTSKKVIYLTFDEGYENGYTSIILDVLKENDVKTIFFVTGSYIDRNPELVKRMLDEGHQVGNHTISHPSLPDIDYGKLEKELLDLDNKLYEKFGVRSKYMRPPAGEYNERTLAAAQQLGYKTIFWSFAYDDWYADKIRGADYAYNKVMTNLHNGAVLLLHAVSKDNADALDRIIKDIKAQGYEIRPFDL